jgi:hypothetical protein
MRRVFPPTLDQLRKELARAARQGWQPSVFHFLGHGDDDGLYFENEHGEAQLVKGYEIKEALSQSPVKLAMLNACWSATKRGVSLIEFLTREQVAEVLFSCLRNSVTPRWNKPVTYFKVSKARRGNPSE